MIAFWNYFIYFAVVAVLLWATGAYAAWKDRKVVAYSATIAGLVVFFSYILVMWITLDRPPMRTMGETRLWYSFFLPLAGVIVYSRWDYKWLLSFSTILSMVFIGVNLLKPEIHSKTLMPALQSPWFAPHVIIYMFAYALLGGAFVMAAYLLFFKKSKIVTHKELDITDNLVYIGWAFLSLGMLTGALWAKDAWGHYWAWDPKNSRIGNSACSIEAINAKHRKEEVSNRYFLFCCIVLSNFLTVLLAYSYAYSVFIKC